MVQPIRIEVVADVDQAEQSLQDLVRAQRGVDAATEEYINTLGVLNRAEQSGIADKRRLETALEQTNRRYLQASQRAARYAGATARVNTETRSAGGAFGFLSRNLGISQGQIQQTSFQIQDIIVQLQGGTALTTTLAQQLPQLAGAFGAVGAAIGTGLALGIPAVSVAMTALTGDSRTLEERFDALSEASENYRTASEAARQATSELGQEFGFAAERAAGVLDVLEELTRSEVVAQIQSISDAMSELFAVGGAGDQRTAIADFFDVDIVFAFGRAARETRDVARQLTAEFRQAQQELAAAEGNLQAQEAALQRLLNVTRRLADANGEVTDEERELVRQIAEALLEAQRLNGEFGNATGVLQIIESLTQSVGVAINIAADNTDSLVAGLNNVSGAAEEAFERARALAAIIAEAEGRRGGGRGGDPRDFGFGEGDLSAVRIAGGGFRVDQDGRPQRGRRRGGGRGRREQDRLPDELEQVIQALATEAELLQTAQEEQERILRESLERRLITQQEFEEQSRRSREEYNRALAQLDLGYQGGALERAQTFFGELAGAFSSGNDRLLQISRAAAAIEGTINAYRAYTQVAADPSLPWYAKIPAALSVFTNVVGAVNAIRGLGSSGGGGGGAPSGGGSGAGATATATPQNVDVLNATVRFVGDPSFAQSPGAVDALADQLLTNFSDRGISVVRSV